MDLVKHLRMGMQDLRRFLTILQLLISVAAVRLLVVSGSTSTTNTMSSVVRTAVVTGANRGLGLEICQQLAAAPPSSPSYVDKVLAVCRSPSSDLKVLSDQTHNKVEIVEGVDVTKEDTYHYLQARLKTLDPTQPPVPVHLLIHNAGAYGTVGTFPEGVTPYQAQSLENINVESMTYSFQLNALAPLFLTKALLPNLCVADASTDDGTARKVIIISSMMGSLTDNTSGGHYGYRTAKAAVNMIGRSLAIDLKDSHVSVGLIHPGYVYTGFTGENAERRPGQRDVDESVRGVLEAIDRVTLDSTGSFWHGNYGEGVKPMSW